MFSAQLPLIASAAALLYGIYLFWRITQSPDGDDKMKAVAAAIAEGAQAYLSRQAASLGVIAVILALLLWIFLGHITAIGFIIGAAASAAAGFIGMNTSIRANVRTAEAAKKGLGSALTLAFRGGSVTGLMVVGLGLLTTTVLYLITKDPRAMIGLGFGGSLISVFARLGGGIYTKSADVGTDMVGKVEAGIPEDDPRNPGVIADLVGDNVGDCAGMAADLFETYVVTLISGMLMAKIIFGTTFAAAITFPLMLASIAVFASIIGIYFVKTEAIKDIMKSLYTGLGVTLVLSLVAFYPLMKDYLAGAPIAFSHLYLSVVIGAVVTLVMVAFTEFYTSKTSKAVYNLAKSSETGHGSNIIAGLALSQESTFAPVIFLALASLAAYSLAGLYGVALAAISMLSTTGIIIAIDAFGPIKSLTSIVSASITKIIIVTHSIPITTASPMIPKPLK